MNSKIVYLILTAALILPASALQAQSATPDAPSVASAPSSTVATGTGAKFGTINVEAAIYASNEGQRDFEALNKKLEPKQTELKGRNDEIDSLKKQLSAQGDKLNDTARGTLVKEIDVKQKSFDRDMQDAREDFQNQQQEIAQRILQKMGPMIVKFASESGYGLIVDTSSPWPQGPVLWNNPSVDITKAVVDAYNVQSGVPAPPKPVGGAPTRPAGTTHPAGTTTKPPATKPSTTP
ncbi:MAG TPA: OmpH family outer membrane protein [Terriglobales bacterium]|jgi:outer membrane protein